MKIYGRRIPKREKLNKFGKLEWTAFLELLFNPTDEVLQEANYKKHVRFELMYSGSEISIPEAKRMLGSNYAVEQDFIDILYYDNE